MKLSFSNCQLLSDWNTLFHKENQNESEEHSTLRLQKFLIEKVSLRIREAEEERKRYLNELLLTGKLLEKIYINSTDIEFAQFYNKELALRLDQFSHQRNFCKEIVFDETELNVEQVFQSIEVKKEAYFQRNHKEIGESHKQELAQMKIENCKLQKQIQKLKEKIENSQVASK